MKAAALGAWILAVSFLMASQAAWAAKLALILGTSDDGFGPAIASLEAEATAKGYQVTPIVSSHERPLASHEGMSALDYIVGMAQPGDQVWISLQCHGATDTGSDGKPDDLTHYCAMGPAGVTSGDVVDHVRLLRDKGVKVVVTDHSCTGGATVQALSQFPDVCAIATTTDSNPGLVSFPDFGTELRDFHPKNFEDLAHVANFDILRKIPQRSYQRAYESRCYNFSKEIRANPLGTTLSEWWRQDNLLRALGKDKIDWNEVARANRDVSTGLAHACERFQSAQTALADPLLLMSSLLEDGILRQMHEQALPAVLKDYEANGIKLPYDRIGTLAGLVHEINVDIDGIRQARRDADQVLAQLNQRVSALVKVSKKKGEDSQEFMRIHGEVDWLRVQADEINRHIGDLSLHLSPVLSVFEDLDCGLRPTPCRDIQI